MLARMRTRFLSIIVAAAGLAALPTAARATDFSGACSGTAVTNVSPAMGLIPHPATATSSGSGTCHGTLDGQPAAGTPVSYQSTFLDSLAGCLTGDESGTMVIGFPGGKTLTLRVQSLAGPLVLAQGSGSGAAAGVFTAFIQLLLGQQPAGLNTACAMGTVTSYKVNWSVLTLGTVSG
jgi:hypothetical protein